MKINNWISKNSAFCCLFVLVLVLWLFFSRFLYTNTSWITTKEGMVHGAKHKQGVHANGIGYTPFPDAEPYQARNASIEAAKATSEYERLRLMKQENMMRDKQDEMDRMEKNAKATKRNYRNAIKSQKQILQKERKLSKMRKNYKRLLSSHASNQNVQPMSLKDCKDTKLYCSGLGEVCSGNLTNYKKCKWNEKFCIDTYKSCHSLYKDL